MKHTINGFLIALVTAVVVPAGWSCKKNDHPSTPVATTSIQLTANAAFGNILTDSTGRALYFFAIDANGNSGCTGGCTAAWPVFYKANLTVSSGLNMADFSSITRTDGTMQTTYKGWPLYYYAQDAKAGDVNGDAVGNTWFVAKPDYTVMLANTQLVGNDGVQYTSQYKPGQEITQYLTDDHGRTLYAFAPDKFKKNTYTKSDFTNNAIWPIDTLVAIKSIPSILDRSMFDTLTVFGKVQLSFKGWPLYYFGRDNSQRGSTKGVSVPSPGVWPVTNNNTVIAPRS